MPANEYGQYIVGANVPFRGSKRACVLHWLKACSNTKCEFSHDGPELSKEELKACLSNTRPPRTFWNKKKKTA